MALLLDLVKQLLTASVAVFPALGQNFFEVLVRCRLQCCSPPVRIYLECKPFYHAATPEAGLPLDLAARMPLISKRMNGREDIFAGLPMRQA